MFGWIKESIDGATAKKLAQVVRQNISMMGKSDRSFILALTAVHRRDLTDFGLPFEVLDDPSSFSVADLQRFDATMSTKMHDYMLRADKFVASRGGRPGEALDRFHRGNIVAAQVWLATIGIGVFPKTREDVRSSWSALMDAQGELRATIHSLDALDDEAVIRRIFAPISFSTWPFTTEEDWGRHCRVPHCVARMLD